MAWPLLAILAAGCDLPGRPKPGSRPVAADRVLDFSTLYGRNCAGCHGADGRLGPAPPLNDSTFLAIVPDAELLRVIERGRPGTPMPAFSQLRGGPLTEAQVKALAGGIKARWRATGHSGGQIPPYSVADGPAAGDPLQGGSVYAKACSPCHGADGKGTKRVGAIRDPAFLALISDQALRRYAITGRPDLGMPGYVGKAGRPADFRPLTSPEIADLVAFLGHWRQEGSATAP